MSRVGLGALACFALGIAVADTNDGTGDGVEFDEDFLEFLGQLERGDESWPNVFVDLAEQIDAAEQEDE